MDKKIRVMERKIGKYDGRKENEHMISSVFF